jgi:glucokinase
MIKRKAQYIGIDIGGSKIDSILWENGRTTRNLKSRTPKSRRKFLACVLDLVKELSIGKNVAGVGVSVAGAINLKQGKILRSPNLRFLKNFGMRSWLHSRTKKPVRVDNDAKAFLRAEMVFGAARGKARVVALTLGTGVGGAVAINGQILRGVHNSAFELGHIIIAQKGDKALTLEDLVSSRGFFRLGVRQPLDAQNKGFAGERHSIRVYEEIGKYLGRGLASLVNIFDPDLIVLGGGISRADYLLRRPALKEMRKYVLSSLKALPHVEISKLKHAAALGAVSLFLS